VQIRSSVHLGLHSDHQTVCIQTVSNKCHAANSKKPSSLLCCTRGIFSLGQLLTTAKAYVPPTFRRALRVPSHCNNNNYEIVLRLLRQTCYGLPCATSCANFGTSPIVFRLLLIGRCFPAGEKMIVSPRFSRVVRGAPDTSKFEVLCRPSHPLSG
jgi:hypothetical protein